jgi:hypothetical protein
MTPVTELTSLTVEPMALRDWQPWHIGVMWIVGVTALGILLRRVTMTFSGTSTSGSGELSAVSVPVVPLLGAVLVLVGMVVVTIRWMDRSR